MEDKTTLHSTALHYTTRLNYYYHYQQAYSFRRCPELSLAAAHVRVPRVVPVELRDLKAAASVHPVDLIEIEIEIEIEIAIEIAIAFG